MTVVPFRRRAVSVDWSGLEGALTFQSEEVSHYFDTGTGQVLLVQSRLIAGDEIGSGLSEQEVDARCATSELIHVEPLPPSIEYDWMVGFVESVKTQELGNQLRRALKGKHPFRRFKDALAFHSEERDRFHAHRADRVWEAMRAWVEEHDIQPRSAEVTKITYDHGMCSRLPPAPSELTRSSWKEPLIPEAIVWSLEREGILDLVKKWGDPESGVPIEVDVIQVRGRGIRTDITFYNRAITLFRSSSEEARRIHRFCCLLAKTPAPA